ncbi:DNA (cytosine-5-)-methyltransferase [Bacillus cereus]
MIVIDLFSGAGGLSEGFHREGYKIIAQVEKDKWACETLKTRNFYHFLKEKNDTALYNEFLLRSENYGSIEDNREIVYKKYPELREKIRYEILNKKFGNPQNDSEATSSREVIKLIQDSMIYNNVNKVDLIIGGPPCQAYSLVGRSRMKDSAEKDFRNYLFYYYLNIVKEFQPTAFVFENVPGILNAKKGKVFEAIKEEFARIGYTILSGKSEIDRENVIDFANYGVHQSRKRVLLFGYKSSLNLPYPDFSKFKFIWGEEGCTSNVIADLPRLQPNEGCDGKLITYEQFSNLNLSAYQRYLRRDSLGIINHKARAINPRDREIYRIAIQKAIMGEQLKYSDLPEELQTHKNKDSFLDRFKVHFDNKVPHTVVAHIAKDGHYNIHPDIGQCRSITVREAARIQGFPDNFKFEGPRTAQYVQVGNAVPPVMSDVIAKAIGELLRTHI